MIALTRISLADTLSKHSGAPYEITDAFVPVIGGKEQIGGGGFAFRKADTELVGAFNGELAELKQSTAVLPIVQPFGFGQAELRASHTAAELCKG